MADRPVESIVILIDSRYNLSERKRIGNRMVGYILDRTKKGRGVGNTSFVSAEGINKYTEGYQKTQEYKFFGKKSSPINLKLTGGMLANLKLLDFKIPGRIIIGFTGGGNNNNKASWMREKGYNFLGLSNDERDKILAEFPAPKSNPTEIIELDGGLSEDLLRRISGS